MIDIKNEKIEVSQLKLGMFISELDKPWNESDFMLQGFVLEEQADLDKIRSTCAYVVIDRTRSIGKAFQAAPKRDVAIKRNSTIRIKAPSEVENKQTPIINKARLGEKVSFFDILREVKNYQPPQNTTSSSNDGTTRNVNHGDDAPLKTSPPEEYTPHNQQSIEGTGSLFDGIRHFLGNLFRQEKLNPATKVVFQDPSLGHLDDHERIIYEQEPSVEEEIAEIHPVFEQSEIVTRALFDAIATDHHMDISSVSDALDSMVESIGRTPDALLWLAKLKKADGLAYTQALNVSITSMAFNSFLALPKEEIKMSGLAGLLQDVGKVKLSSDVLSKKEKLTEEEYEYVQRHVDESIMILRSATGIPREVTRLVAAHHERVDGSGYPFNIKGEKLSLLAQSAGLIDTYCAMTNHRSYTETKSHQQALDEIHALSGKQFSTEIFDQFIQFMGIYPVSSLVELNTGEVGVVIQQNQVRRLMPRVMLLLDVKKERYNMPVVLDLIYKPMTPSGDLYTIVKSIPADSYGLNPNEFYV